MCGPMVPCDELFCITYPPALGTVDALTIVVAVVRVSTRFIAKPLPPSKAGKSIQKSTMCMFGPERVNRGRVSVVPKLVLDAIDTLPITGREVPGYTDGEA